MQFILCRCKTGEREREMVRERERERERGGGGGGGKGFPPSHKDTHNRPSLNERRQIVFGFMSLSSRT